MSIYDSWYEHPWAAADVETSGLDLDDRVVQLGIVRFEDGKVVDRFSSLVWTGKEIPAQATAIHGIKTSDTAGAPEWHVIMPQIVDIVRGTYPVAYNVAYDKRMFMGEMARIRAQYDELPIQIFQPHARWVCPLTWTRSVDRFIKGGHKLVQVCQRRGIELPQAHSAVHDAEAAGHVLWSMRHDIGEMTITELLRQQQLMADAQERKFAAWRARSARR